MRLQPGTFLQGDKYRIIDVLGQGGFGISYLAEQVMAERKVCIKEFFPKEYYKRDEDSHSISLGTQGSAEIMDLYKAKFVKEAKTIAKLDHPNIIHIFDVFTENNTAYYVMEYIDGESLSDVVKRNGSALAESVAVDYIKQAASALGYIHERKIMHLDVKPANIMLRKEDGRPILIDFGLSKQYDAEGNQTSSTPVGISAGFAPMEQYQQGGVKEFSPETDIYSLGASLYYLVTGCVPPQAAAIVDDGLPELPAHLSANVRNAIERSMEVQRKKRPHSMDEFVALLGDGNTAPTAPVVNNVVATAAPSVEDESTRFGAPLNDESTKFAEVPKTEPKRAEAPKKEWTPKHSEEKPKTSDDEKKKSRWWVWLLGVLVVVGGVLFVLGGNEENNHGAKSSSNVENIVAEEHVDANSAECDDVASDANVECNEDYGVCEECSGDYVVCEPYSGDFEVCWEDVAFDESTAQEETYSEEGIYKVGDLYDENGKKGVVFEVSADGRHGKIVSLDQTEAPWDSRVKWDSNKQKFINGTKTGANSMSDGKANTDKIMSRTDSEYFKPFVWCSEKGDDWYLPAKEELWSIYTNKSVINSTLAEYGGTELSKWYWSSTEDDGFRAWLVDMGSGYTLNNSKYGTSYVRAVSAF